MAVLLAEFETPEHMLRAIRALRDAGYTRIDAFTPYPVAGTDEALGLGRSPLARMVAPFAFGGAALAYFVQWYTNAYDYPLNVGGRPAHAAPAFVPVTFEMGVLSAALTIFVLVLALSGLPTTYSPVLAAPGFERASIDRFFLGIDARDAHFDRRGTERALRDVGAVSVVEAA